MPLYRVSSASRGALDITAPNWVVALGKGFELFGVLRDVTALACEVLPNGRVIVRNMGHGGGFVVSPADADDTEDDLVDAATADDQLGGHDEAIPSAEEPGTEEHSGPDGVATAPTPVDACHRALAWACHLVAAESGAVMLCRAHGQLEIVSACGPAARVLVGRTLPTGTGFAWFCVNNAASFNIRDAYGDPRFNAGIDASTGYRTRALVCVPIRMGDHVLGCLELINRIGGGAFGRAAANDAEVVARALAERLMPS